MVDDDSEARTTLRVASAGAEEELLAAVRDAASVRVDPVGSTGLPALEPLVVATRDGRASFYAACSPERAAAVAVGVADGDPPDPDAVAEDAGMGVLPLPDAGPLAVGRRRVLGGCGWRRPGEPDDYRAAGGFACADADAADALRAAEGVLGRGWGDGAHDAPVADLWRTAADADGDPAVVVNAHGDAGDGLLLDGDPFAVLDGAALAARAVGASDVYVFAAAESERALARAKDAAPALPADATVEIVAGPSTYRAAEPTMAVEAVEGSDRLEARLRPPGPERAGVNGRPTLVHTARTLAHVAAAARGDAADTRLVTVRGDVEREATVELPADDALSTALSATAVDGEFKAACVGGRFGGVTDALDVGVGAEALAAADLGTEGVVEVLNATRCPVAFVGRRTRTAAETNCGRCVPCREGSTQLAELLRDVYDGRYDAEKIEELARVMERTSICDFGRDVPRPVRTAMDAFAAEFEAHAEGDCPSGACAEAMEMEATH